MYLLRYNSLEQKSETVEQYVNHSGNSFNQLDEGCGPFLKQGSLSSSAPFFHVLEITTNVHAVPQVDSQNTKQHMTIPNFSGAHNGSQFLPDLPSGNEVLIFVTYLIDVIALFFT